ncbi:MAG TPA: A/G-specific adenine glycosylase, partial [Bacillota bacterium]
MTDSVLDSAPDPAAVAAQLEAWYRHHGRDLPWRQTRDPYAILVAEFMLQQTRVETVIPFYRRFLDRFPDVRALAAAPIDEVLALWEGLGYYRRARHLHAAARMIWEELGGRVPDTPAGLRALPGVG